ncbi:hypothetical protein RWE15_08865 [Virgibacillus halophilus]|uniref:Uncharacterized protein n=1 Tax=Tigheibacillus halophilus TaxID=361280 RepID=A0ABU5C5F5_9BACI|nr:hypothetical protein [Virgibacillus halophilus]
MVHMLNNSIIMVMQLFHIPDPAFATYTNISQVRDMWLPNTVILAISAVLVILFYSPKDSGDQLEYALPISQRARPVLHPNC